MNYLYSSTLRIQLATASNNPILNCNLVVGARLRLTASRPSITIVPLYAGSS